MVSSIEVKRTDCETVLDCLAGKVSESLSDKQLNNLNGGPLMQSPLRGPLHEQDGGHDLHGYRPQDGRSILSDHVDALRVRSGEMSARADVTGANLIPDMVQQARRVDMDYFEPMGVYERVPCEALHQV